MEGRGLKKTRLGGEMCTAVEAEGEELFTTFSNRCSGGQEHQGDAGGGEGIFCRRGGGVSFTTTS